MTKITFIGAGVGIHSGLVRNDFTIFDPLMR